MSESAKMNRGSKPVMRKKFQAVQIRKAVVDAMLDEGVNMIPPSNVRSEIITTALCEWLLLRGVKIDFSNEIGSV